MLKIGLTGGIGSGKTTVAQIFEVLAIPVYYADDAAKELMNHDPVLIKKIISTFGTEAYKNGILDRSYLGGLVFKDAEKLALLNAIVHPATLDDAADWMQKQHDAPYAIKEAALIFEASIENFFDYIIGVTAPESIRLKRVMERDQATEQSVLQRMNQQINDEEKMSRCHFVIHNDESQAILSQVLSIHETLLRKGKDRFED